MVRFFRLELMDVVDDTEADVAVLLLLLLLLILFLEDGSLLPEVETELLVFELVDDCGAHPPPTTP